MQIPSVYAWNMQSMCMSNYTLQRATPTFTMYILAHIKLRVATPTKLSIYLLVGMSKSRFPTIT